MSGAIKDSKKSHWVNGAPLAIRPYLQLSRLDRPVGYWLLALPGWIGIVFASLSHGFSSADLKWAALILIGAIAMRGAGCTFNDIVDQDLDAQVERTALRPLPAGTVTTKQAWAWLLAQCAIGLIVLLCLPRLAQIIALCSIPLVAAYPFMKRITWWPQVWLGLTFNWAVLVAYAVKSPSLSPALIVLYIGLVFWTIGYDTIYACQDIEDDALIGVKSTARRFGKHIKPAITICYCAVAASTFVATGLEIISFANPGIEGSLFTRLSRAQMLTPMLILWSALTTLLMLQPLTLKADHSNALGLFKFSIWALTYLALALLILRLLWSLN